MSETKWTLGPWQAVPPELRRMFRRWMLNECRDISKGAPLKLQ